MEKSVSQLQKKKKKISKDLFFYEEWYNHVGTFIKYTVMMQAGLEKAIKPSKVCCEIQGE